MTLDLQVRQVVYGLFAAKAARPSAAEVASEVGVSAEEVEEAFARLRAQRVLFLDEDGSIRMAPPFSGIPTQHVAEVNGLRYFANCAWDSLGIPAALRAPGTVYSRCEQSGEPLHLPVGTGGPGPTDWVFHCQVPAAHWWDDIVFT